MKEYLIEIEGVAPLRMNKLTEAAKDSVGKGSVKLDDKTKIDEAWSRAYTNEKGQYIIEGIALKACILKGAAKVKLGRGKAKNDLKAVLYPKQGEILLNYKKQPVLIKIPCKIPPRTGMLALKLFPIFEDWSATFTLIITDDRFPANALEQSIVEAGMYAGLYDGRPDFGRFILKKFEEV